MNQSLTHAVHRLVGPMHCVEQSEIVQHVHVLIIILAYLQIVDQNVQSILTVQAIKLALEKNAEIHALVHVAWAHVVRL